MSSLNLETKPHVSESNDFINLETEVQICAGLSELPPDGLLSVSFCYVARPICFIQLQEHDLKTLLPITGLGNTKSDSSIGCENPK